MSFYALIRTTDNAIIRYEDFAGRAVPALPFDKGLRWERKDPPEPAAPSPIPRRIIRDWEFRNRFTQAQLVGIMRSAMLGDDVAALVWLRLSTASDGVDLDDPDNVAGVQYVATIDPTIDPAVVLA